MLALPTARLATVTGGLPKFSLKGLIDAMCLSEKLPPPAKRPPASLPGDNFLRLLGVK